MLHPLPLPLSSCLGCIPPLIGLPSLRFYAVGSSLFLLSVCFCLCSLFYRDDVLCWLLLARPFLYAFHAHLRFPVDLVWFRLSCDHGWIRSGSVNVRKQQKQQQPHECSSKAAIYHANSSATSSNNLYRGRNCFTTHASKATYRYFLGTRLRLPRRVTLERVPTDWYFLFSAYGVDMLPPRPSRLRHSSHPVGIEILF